jgi:hypothetical protein
MLDRYVPLLALCPCLVVTACGDTTTGARVELPLEVASRLPEGPDARGFTVALDTAHLRLGPVRFFAGEPIVRAAIEVLAHPGHYVAGEALAEVLDVATVDLLAATPVVLGTARGVTGAYRSAAVTLAPIDTVIVAGTATRDGAGTAFAATLDIERDLEGLPAGFVVDGSPGRVRLTIDLTRWFARVDFAQPLTPGTVAHNALLRGVYSADAFAFTWIAAERP